MKRTGHKFSAIAVITAFSMILSSCSVDKDKLSEGLDDLRDSITDEDPDETTAPATDDSDESRETEPAGEPLETITPTPTPEPTATPVPTSTPTPTPIPAPERVDFSEFIQTEITDDITINCENFGESYVTEEDVTVAAFEGERIAIDAGTDNVSAAINLILDGFYCEAEGLYNRYTNEGLAQLSVEGASITEQQNDEENDDEDDDEDQEETVTSGSYETYGVTVGYAYSDNGRVFSVIMDYEVIRGDSIVTSRHEYASFDLLTGQYVTIASVASDYNGLLNAFASTLANSVEDEEIDPSDCEVTFIACQTPGAETATAEIYGTINGHAAHTTVDLNNYSEYLNRYGKTVYGVA